MKILYVGGMSGPLKDILKGKKENEITHAAQFFHPWYKLVKKGHQVDFIVASNFNDDFNIQVDWFNKENIYANIYDPYSEAPWYRRIFRRIKRFAKLIYYTNKAVKENHYDFIYCLTYYEGLAGNIVANFRGIPCGMRSMGTMLNEDFKKHGVMGTALRKPMEYLMFKLNKNFIIMTNDGTKGDVVYENWKPKPEKYNFHFLKTGIDMTGVDKLSSEIEIPKHDYLFFAARFDNWKRHDRVIKILHILHQKNIKIHLYFAGGIQSQNYSENIHRIISEYGLVDYVHFLGSISQHEVKLLAYHAVANPSMYDVSNLGNVFFEIFSIGSIVLGINDGTLDEYINNNVNGFIVNDEIHASQIVENLMNDKVLSKKIRENAITTAKEKVLSLDDRFDMEVDLIEKACHSKDGSKDDG
jgi:glycosyltransferase involved in cell wall biosynthesis